MRGEVAGIDSHGPTTYRYDVRTEEFFINRLSFSICPARQSGAWVSGVFPHIAGLVDDNGIVKSMHTEAINHDPALTFMQTGAP